MDIRKWLDETELPAQELAPSLPDQLGLAPCLRPKEGAERPRKKRKHLRSTSDSSLLDSHPQRRSPSPRLKRKASATSLLEDGSRSDGSSGSSRSTRRSTSSEPYARRPRRKTRPERYEPMLKEDKGHASRKDQRKRDKTRSSRRRSKHRSWDRPDTGPGRSFHAKNVPTNRLTVGSLPQATHRKPC